MYIWPPKNPTFFKTNNVQQNFEHLLKVGFYRAERGLRVKTSNFQLEIGYFLEEQLGG